MRPEDTAETSSPDADKPSPVLKALTPESETPWGTVGSSRESSEPPRAYFAANPSPSRAPSRFKPGAFTVFTLLICGIAVVFEAVAHPCAGIFQLDPIPNFGVLGLYVLTVVMLGLNHAVLTGSDDGRFGRLRQSPRALGLLIVGTVISIMVALSAGYMFLPLSPFGALLVLFAGLGFLLLCPYLALISLCLQLKGMVHNWRGTGAGGEVGRTLGAASLAATGLFVWLIGIPIAAAYYAERAIRTDSRADFDMLRKLNSEGVLLDFSYNRKPNYWTCLGFNSFEKGWWPTAGFDMPYVNRDAARRAYFLATGKPFEQAARPMSFSNNTGNTWLFGGANDVAIEETGGFLVGRKGPGLWLSSTHMDGAVNKSAATATVEWTMKFRNDTDEAQEARADILLPNDAVVHGVSLWINGVEQPARYGHPDRVRAAYQQVAVVQKRDPLLVTMPAPGHVLAQCFPVPAKGEMKIKLGFSLRPRTAPDGKTTLELPAFGMVNFDVPGRLTHDLSFPTESRQQVRWDAPGLFAPPLVKLDDVTDTTSAFPEVAPVNLIIAIDASEGMNGVFSGRRMQEWKTALNTLPPRSRVAFLHTDRPEKRVYWAPGDFLPEDFLSRRFRGGTDPGEALVKALNDVSQMHRSGMNSAVVFIHAASPHGITNLDIVRPALQRGYWDGPALIGLQTAQEAPDTLIKDLSGFPRVLTCRAFVNGSDFGQRLVSSVREALAFTYAPPPRGIGISLPDAPDAAGRMTLGLAVLDAWRYANTLPTEKALDVRIRAGKAAAKARLVTPLSSAVVLETKEQYEKAGLDEDGKDKPDKAKEMQNPATPEPGTLGMVVIGLLALPLLKRKAHHRGG